MVVGFLLENGCGEINNRLPLFGRVSLAGLGEQRCDVRGFCFDFGFDFGRSSRSGRGGCGCRCGWRGCGCCCCGRSWRWWWWRRGSFDDDALIKLWSGRNFVRSGWGIRNDRLGGRGWWLGLRRCRSRGSNHFKVVGIRSPRRGSSRSRWRCLDRCGRNKRHGRQIGSNRGKPRHIVPLTLHCVALVKHHRQPCLAFRDALHTGA